jgi:putative ABC transport system permease protein
MWRQTLRGLARSRGLVVVVVVTLALGIGGTTAIFSVVDATVLRPLPFPDSQQLVVLDDTRDPARRSAFSYPSYLDVRTQSQTLPHVAAYVDTALTLTGRGEARRVLAIAGTDNFFDTLAVMPALGRGFAPGEDDPGAPRVVVLSHAMWEKLGGEREILGQKLTLDGTPYTVVGVAPPAFQYPLQGSPIDAYIPFPPSDAASRRSRGAHYLSVFGRLAPGRSIVEAGAELGIIHARLEAIYADAVAGRMFTVAPLHESLVKDIRGTLLLLLGAVGVVLLIACANVASLLLTRASGRQRELAIRAALGASRGRLVAALLAESMFLSVLGGVGGALLALWGVDWLRAVVPAEIGRIRPISVDLRVLGFAFAVTLVTGLVFGLIPAWNASRARAGEALQTATSRGGVRHARTRSVLVILEVAFAMVLLTGAGLMIGSLRRLLDVSPGFDPAGVTVAELSLPDTGYDAPEQRIGFYRRLVERLAVLPGADGAAVATPVPFSGNSYSFTLEVVGRPPAAPGKQPATQFRSVGAAYHRAMRIPVLAGRGFEPADDDPAAPPVVLVSEALARRELPGEDPLGRKLSLGYHRDVQRTIVGVVGSVKANGLDADAGIEVYVPYAQAPMSFFSVVARSRGPDLAASLRAAVAAVDRNLPVDIQTMDDLMRESVARRRLSTLLFGMFAAVALALALIGIYGVVSYGVAQRGHEMSLRLALGARPNQVAGLVVRQGLALALAGVVVGIGLALLLGRAVAGMLYGVEPTDPATFAVTALSIVAVTAAASYLPARRAARLDPMQTLRCE